MTRPSNYGKVTHNKQTAESVVYLFVLADKFYTGGIGYLSGKICVSAWII
jgi:hypothetical protein